MHNPSPVFAHRVRRASIVLVGLVLAGVLLVPGAASAAGFSAKVRFPNHNPIANKPWVITWTANRGRQKLSGSDRYEFFIGSHASGSPVRTEKGVSFRNGSGRDTLKFPGEAVGHQLTLDVVISTKYGTVGVPWVLTTKR